MVTEEDVILVEMPNRVGEMQKVAAKIAAAGINISYAYATVGSGRFAFCVLKTNNDKKVSGWSTGENDERHLESNTESTRSYGSSKVLTYLSELF
jgi:hypothetical protein